MNWPLHSFLIGSLLTANVAFAKTEKSEKTIDPATKSRFEKLEVFNKVLYLIESQYYREVDTDKLIEGAINGMMSTLDPHSSFLAKEVYEKMQEETSGEFGGLGIEVTQKDGVLIIVTPIEDSPAFKAGIKPGDRIVEINSDSMVGATLQQAIEKLRGKMKSKVVLGIVREGVEGITNYELVRDIVYLKPVKFELIQNEYAYVRLTQFQKKSAEYIIDALKKMKASAKDKEFKGIILDMRSNPGGLLDEAVDVSSIFLKEGVVVSTEGRDPKHKEIRYVKKTGFKELNAPLIVLINGSSASASEIVSGALQDHKRALVMGSQSFGKGSVQSIARVDDVGGVKLTIAQYMTPNGRKIQATGIVPDIEVGDAEAEWFEENRKIGSGIREKDLKNHLTATIETAEEKVKREEEEKADRLMRNAKLKELRESKKKKVEHKEDMKLDEDRKIAPSEDYQVNQAINYLKNMKLIKDLNL